MPRLRALRTKEDIEKVPATEPVLIDVSEEPETPKIEAKEEVKAPPQKAAVETPPVEPEPARDDNKDALQKRFEEQLRAERLQREAVEKQLQDAQRARQESDARLVQEQDRSIQAQNDAIIADLAAAQAEGDAAQNDYEAASSAGDYKAAAEAQRRLSRAESRIDRLEVEKAINERKIEQKKSEPKEEKLSVSEQIENYIRNLPEPPSVKEWLRARPHYLTDSEKFADLGYHYRKATRDGIQKGTPEFFEFMETSMGERAPSKDTKQEQEEETVVSAPPTREAPSMSNGQRPSTTKVTLTPEERELCKINNISEIEYAKNKLKMIQAKKDGYIQ